MGVCGAVAHIDFFYEKENYFDRAISNKKTWVAVKKEKN